MVAIWRLHWLATALHPQRIIEEDARMSCEHAGYSCASQYYRPQAAMQLPVVVNAMGSHNKSLVMKVLKYCMQV